MRDIERVAQVLEVPERGTELVQQLTSRMESIADLTRRLPRKRVATIEWIEPLMSGGNWMPELVEMAGGENLFGTAGEHSHWLSWDALIAADPEVLVVLPCSYDIDTSLREIEAMTAHPAWANLRAVQQNQVYITDGNQYFNRPGPRLVDSLEILAEILHPEVFHFGHEGQGWVKYSPES